MSKKLNIKCTNYVCFSLLRYFHTKFGHYHTHFCFNELHFVIGPWKEPWTIFGNSWLHLLCGKVLLHVHSPHRKGSIVIRDFILVELALVGIGFFRNFTQFSKFRPPIPPFPYQLWWLGYLVICFPSNFVMWKSVIHGSEDSFIKGRKKKNFKIDDKFL